MFRNRLIPVIAVVLGLLLWAYWSIDTSEQKPQASFDEFYRAAARFARPVNVGQLWPR